MTAHADTINEAADTIDRLERELAEARAQIAEHIRLKNELVAKCYPAMDERDELRAQIAAKDAALQRIAEYTSPLHSAGEIARAALSQPAPAQEDKP